MKTMPAVSGQVASRRIGRYLDLLRCPVTGAALHLEGDALIATGGNRYRIEDRIPLFAEQFCSPEGRRQQEHYDEIADAYAINLGYPHTEEYMNYLDRALLDLVDRSRLGTMVEICCGLGEAFRLLDGAIDRGIGIDISAAMLRAAAKRHAGDQFLFVQGDATLLPLAPDSIDSAFMLGGIHHVNNRQQLFAEIARILRPGGRLYFREPVNDFFLWRAIRTLVYRLSPLLDHQTEHPLRYQETVPLLEAAGLRPLHWQTHGFLGFCLFMNADVLVFNRVFRFVPGIRAITRAAARLDEWTVAVPGLTRAGLQVIGVIEKC
jgi:ubiquinone/menaquinone biosynthesis C-methylase UbiE